MSRKELIIKTILNIILMFTSLVLIIITPFNNAYNIGMKIFTITAYTFIFITTVIIQCLEEKNAGGYRCPNCKEEHNPTTKEFICAMHIGFKRHLKCPYCNKKYWMKKVFDEDKDKENNNQEDVL